jgi:ABC-2 type transport system permease protein
MNKLIKISAALKKDFLLLLRDSTSLLLLFFLPIVMVVLITSIQIAAFDLINKDKINLLFVNNDKGIEAKKFQQKIESFGRFHVIEVKGEQATFEILKKYNAYVALEIPQNFSLLIMNYNFKQTQGMLQLFGMADTLTNTGNSLQKNDRINVKLVFDPVMKEDFKSTITQALNSIIQLQDSETLIASMHKEINGTDIPLSNSVVSKSSITFVEYDSTSTRQLPNATQHNIPAWTLFAMFFMVVSLGSTIVKEKTTGSFLRLQLMPTPFYYSIVSKCLIYFLLACFQIGLLIAIGFYLFPMIDLPQLNLDVDLIKLMTVIVVTSLCAIFYSICIGLFANSVEQSNGFGSISVVILSALGGVMVPSFAMPTSMHLVMKLSPIYWSLNAFYDVFLTTSSWQDLWLNLFPLLIMLMVLFLLILFALMRKKLL